MDNLLKRIQGLPPKKKELILSRLAAYDQLVESAEPQSGAQKLSAFMVLKQNSPPLSQQEIRSFLKNKLPDYMVPAEFVILDELPLTPNGKIDRAAVSKIIATENNVEIDLDAAPKTETEKLLAQIWGDLLGMDNISIYDNFLEIGGDSLISIRVIARANEAGLNLPAQLLFDHPTIAELASLIEEKSTDAQEQEVVHGEFPLLPIQQWFLEWEHPEADHWNQARMLQTPGDVDAEKLEKVLQQLIAYHDALRMQVKKTADGLSGFIPEATDFSLDQVDLSTVDGADRASEMNTHALRLHRSLDLGKGPLFRAAYFNFGPGTPGRLLLVIHHFVVDWVSWGILVDDLARLYQLEFADQANQQTLPAKTNSIKTWAERLRDYSNSPEMSAEMGYWLSITEQPETPLPVEIENWENTVSSEQRVYFSLPQEATLNLLNDANQAYQTSVEELLLTALVKTISDWTGGSGLKVGLEGHGREELFEDLALYRTVGWFTSYFPLMLKMDNPLDPGLSVKQIKEQVRKLPHRGIGYGVLRYLSGLPGAQKLQSSSYPQVLFNYLGRKETTSSESTQFHPVDEPVGKERSVAGLRRYHFELNAHVEENQLKISWAYSQNMYHKSTIERLCDKYISDLTQIIDHCLHPEAGGYTPSDFPLADLDDGELDILSGLLDDID